MLRDARSGRCIDETIHLCRMMLISLYTLAFNIKGESSLVVCMTSATAQQYSRGCNEPEITICRRKRLCAGPVTVWQWLPGEV